MSAKIDWNRYRTNWQDEVDSVYLYRALARMEKNADLSKVYSNIADVEQKHAHFWEVKMRESGLGVPFAKPTARSRTLAFLASRFGPRFILPTIQTLEQAGRDSYDTQPEVQGTSLVADEHSHGRLIRAIRQTTGRGMEGGLLARLEGRHRGALGGNALRAAVLGANDGLVSNLSLMMGVAGAAMESRAVLVTGVAGLLAGACSMALGEWLSVQSSRELYERQIEAEAEELVSNPRDEQAELALIYQAKGMPKEEAEKLAETLVKNPAKALATLAREELGIDPESMGGSPWEAALTSFALFAFGAAVPIVPFFFLTGAAAAAASLAFGAVGLFAVGAGITLFTGRGLVRSGLRQLSIGLIAAGVTYGIGRMIGASLS
jgi:VIT1/CCC1 family predicted Fe2+/Mn2+ transporter